MYKISEILAEKLRGKVLFAKQFFNPMQDENGQWWISEQEVNFCTNWRYKTDLIGLTKGTFVPVQSPIDLEIVKETITPK
jgi:hypothetical protein